MRTALLLAAAILGTFAGGCTDGSGPPALPVAGTPEATPAVSSPALPVVTATAIPSPGGTPPPAASATAVATANPNPAAPPDVLPIRGRAPGAVHFVETLAGRRFNRPTDASAYPGRRVLIAEQSGLVLLLDAATAEERIFLDGTRRGTPHAALPLHGG